MKRVLLSWGTWSEVCDFVKHVNGYNIPPEEATDPCGEEGPAYIGIDLPGSDGKTIQVRHGDWITEGNEPNTYAVVFPPSAPDPDMRTALERAKDAESKEVWVDRYGEEVLDRLLFLEAQISEAKRIAGLSGRTLCDPDALAQVGKFFARARLRA